MEATLGNYTLYSKDNSSPVSDRRIPKYTCNSIEQSQSEASIWQPPESRQKAKKAKGGILEWQAFNTGTGRNTIAYVKFISSHESLTHSMRLS